MKSRLSLLTLSDIKAISKHLEGKYLNGEEVALIEDLKARLKQILLAWEPKDNTSLDESKIYDTL